METTEKPHYPAGGNDDREERLLRRAYELGCGSAVSEKLARCSYAEALLLFSRCEELCRQAAELGIRDKIQLCIEAGNIEFAASAVKKAYADCDARMARNAIMRLAAQ